MTKKTTTFNAADNTIYVTCGTKKAETDPVATVCEWEFDMNSWTDEEVMKLAARSLIIDAQRLYRKGEIEATAHLNKDAMTVERKPRGPVDKKKQASEFLTSMSEEDRLAFLKENGLV